MGVDAYLIRSNLGNFRASDLGKDILYCSQQAMGARLRSGALIQGLSIQDQPLCQDLYFQGSELPLIFQASTPEPPSLPGNRGCTCIYFNI